MNVFIVCLFLFIFPAKSEAYTYPQRFSNATMFSKSKHGEDAGHIVRNLARLTSKYPWLATIEQPSVEISFKRRWYDIVSVKGLPPKLFSERQTIYGYEDGTEVSHVYIAPGTPDYEYFGERYRYQLPVMVFLRDRRGKTIGNYIYNYRPLNYLQDVFGSYGFDLRDFLVDAPPPLLNMGSGGHGLSVSINNDRELGKYREESLDAFSLDISGSYSNYNYNPWYLFANIENTGLPDNSFGTILCFGGPLKSQKFHYREALEIIKEITRIASPRGQILIEFDIPPRIFIPLLEVAKVPYRDFVVYDGIRINKGIKSRSNLLHITLDKNM